MTEEITDAHSKEIWSMCLYADKKGFVTASADQTVKFWSFEALKVNSQFSKFTTGIWLCEWLGGQNFETAAQKIII